MTNPKGLPRASHSGRMLLGDAAVFVHVLPSGAAIVEAATVEALLGLPESGLGAFLASLPGTDRVTFLRSRESCSMCKAPASHYVRETSAKVCGKHRTWSEKRGIGTREWSGRDVQAVGVPAEKMSDMLISFWQANNGTPEGNRARDIVRAVVKRGMRASGHSEAPLDFLMAAATPPRPK